MRTIPIDYTRTEHDDFVLNVQPYMSKYDGAQRNEERGCWIIKPLYE